MTSDPDVSVRVPEAIEPIVAYRAWKCPRGVHNELVLSSLNAWRWRRGWNRASCQAIGRSRSEGPVHEAPAEGCTCGFYAMRDLSGVAVPFLPSLEGERLHVLVGKVELAGKVIEHERGYRAERARVMEILPAPGQEETAQMLAAAYGVPVSDEVLEAFPRLTAEAEAARGTVRPPRPLPWRSRRRPDWDRGIWGEIGVQLALVLAMGAARGYLTSHVGLVFAVLPSLLLLWIVGGARLPTRVRSRRTRR